MSPVQPDSGPQTTVHGHLEVAVGLTEEGQYRVLVVVEPVKAVAARERVGAELGIAEAEEVIEALQEAIDFARARGRDA